MSRAANYIKFYTRTEPVPKHPAPTEPQTPWWWSEQRFLLQFPKIGGLLWKAARNRPAGTGILQRHSLQEGHLLELNSFVLDYGQQHQQLRDHLTDSRREISGEMGTEKRRGDFILNKMQEQNTPLCAPLSPSTAACWSLSTEWAPSPIHCSAHNIWSCV